LAAWALRLARREAEYKKKQLIFVRALASQGWGNPKMHMPIEDLTISEVAFKRLTATLLRRLEIWLERDHKKYLKRPLSLVSFVVSRTNENAKDQ
jgi:hypothetical protein